MLNWQESSEKRNPSISRGVWQSFMILTIAIIALIWLLQTVFLNSYYKFMKQNQILKAGREIAALVAGDNDADKIAQIAFDNNLRVMLVTTDGLVLVEQDMLGRGSIFYAPNFLMQLGDYIEQVREGQLTEHVEIMFNAYVNNEALLVVKSVTTADGELAALFLNGNLEPIWATADILKSQLIVITVALLGLSAMLSFYLSRRISHPIVKITDSAGKLAKGDYSPDFEGGKFSEIGRLAETLNTAAVELGQVEALRRELVANVSHDLRTPLTMIKAYAEMVRDLTGDNPEKRTAQLNIIVDEADRLGRLVNDLVAISREETQGEALELETYDIVQQLVQLVDRFKLSYPDYQFSVSIGHSCKVTADRDRIDQVLYNLVTNAVNYTGEDKVVKIRQVVEGNTCRIEILDSGPGIPESELDLIWQRYYRSSFHKMSKAGTGLGLSIVKEALDAHGAAFGAQNRPEGGSCFYFELAVEA